MRNKFCVLTLIVLMTGILSLAITKVSLAAERTFDLSAIDFAESMGTGWNLGNNLDAYSDGVSSETAWGNPVITQELIHAIADAGFTTVRIPVTWFGHIGDAESGYEIEDEWLDRVQEVVDMVMNEGMYAIINMHHDGNNDFGNSWLTVEDYPNAVHDNWQWVTWIDDEAKQLYNQELIQEKYAAMWQQIAVRFCAYDAKLIFESMNEVMELWNYNPPSNSSSMDNLNTLNQIFVNTVRATGSNNAQRYLLLAGYNTNVWYTTSTYGYGLPSDTATDKLMVSVHFYDPYDYALNEDKDTIYKWGQEVLDLGDEHAPSWGQESNITKNMEQLKTEFTDNGIPVIIGEYGNIDKTNENTVASEYRRYYLEYVTYTIQNYAEGIVPIYWDNGWTGEHGFALFDRETGKQVQETLIDAITRYNTNGAQVRSLFSREMFEDVFGTYDSANYTEEEWGLFQSYYQAVLIAADEYAENKSVEHLKTLEGIYRNLLAPGDYVTSVKLDKPALTLTSLDAVGKLTAVITPNTAIDQSVSWTSGDDSIATVDSEGKVTAVGYGTTVITVTTNDGGYTAACEVMVVIPLESIKLSKSETTIIKGSTETLSVIYSPENTTDNKAITWSSSDESIATIEAGVITAVKEGTAVITAIAGDKRAACKVTVKGIPLVSISIDKSSLTLEAGKSDILSVLINPRDTTEDTTIYWVSSDENIAAITSSGVVNAKAAGTAIITATVGNKTAACQVTVTKANTGIKIPLDSITITTAGNTSTLQVGKTLQLSVLYNPTDTTDDKTVIWTSSDSGIATIKDGTVTGISAGKVTITAKVGDKAATYILTINAVKVNKVTSTSVPTTGDAGSMGVLVISIVSLVIVIITYKRKRIMN